MLLWILLAVLGQDDTTEEYHSLPISCPPGQFKEGNYCLQCPAGKFSPENSDICTDCPEGMTSMPGSVCMPTTTTATNDEHEYIDDVQRAPIANALELHNEAESAHARAQEAQEIAEREREELAQVYEHKISTMEELHSATTRFVHVHQEKIQAEEANHYAIIQYEDKQKEAEFAEKEANAAKEQSEQAAQKAHAAAHAVKMQSEGEANDAVIKAKLEKEEHYVAQQQLEEKIFEHQEEANEAALAEEEAEKALEKAHEQKEEAEIARVEVEVAESHLNIQKAEALDAQVEAEKAMHEHKIAAAHHQNVLVSTERNEKVWSEMLKEDCMDDPKGLVVNDPSKDCKDVGNTDTHWNCDHFDEDFNGHKTFIWEICPKSCNMCGTNRDHYYEEHRHKQDEEDDLPECLRDCPFDGLDFNDAETACPWWEAEGPHAKTDSCFNGCSPGVMYYVGEHVNKVCFDGPHDDPLECAKDCPAKDLDPHSAESFCPWFSREKNNVCFNDCSDKFLNMAQAHAQHTCFDYEFEGEQFMDYIIEPIVGANGEIGSSNLDCLGGFYPAGYTCKVCPASRWSNAGSNECYPCPEGKTSTPGSSKITDCFVRGSKTDESEDKASNESEDRQLERTTSANEHYDTPRPYHGKDYATESNEYTPQPYHATDYTTESYYTPQPYHGKDYVTESNEYYPTPLPYHATDYTTESYYTPQPYQGNDYATESSEYHTPNPYHGQDYATESREYSYTSQPNVNGVYSSEPAGSLTDERTYSDNQSPAFDNEEYYTGQSGITENEELTAPVNSENSPSMEVDGETGLSSSGNQ